MIDVKHIIFNKITKKLRNNLSKTITENISDILFDDVDEKLLRRERKIHSDNMSKENMKRKLGVIDVDNKKMTLTGHGVLII